MIAAIVAVWAITSLAAVAAIWHMSRTVTYSGRHTARRGELSTMETPAPRFSLAEYIDVLTMPIQGCALPPVPVPAAYDQLVELRVRRVSAARAAMRRRSALARAGKWPSGEFRAVAA